MTGGRAAGAVAAVDPVQFLAARDQLAEVYQAVFCVPPWNEPAERAVAFADRLTEHTGRGGFTAAWIRTGETLAGFAYGFTTTSPFPDHGCYASLRTTLGMAVERLVGAFEVVELAVRTEHRRTGAGRALLNAVSAGRPAWLLTSPHITSAVGFYRRLGWREHPADLLVLFTHRVRLPNPQPAG